MLAPSQIPQRYIEWNKAHGAPNGRRIRLFRFLKHILPTRLASTLRGPFSIQGNNSIRTFEYPWAFEAARLQSGMRILEIGGGLAGLQFVMDRAHCHVVNVDPGMKAEGRGWPCDQDAMRRLNRCFGTNVELRNTTADKANLEPQAYDRAFSISVLEHLPDNDIRHTMGEAHRALKPGGLFILTVDLFLYLHPFCSRQTNEFGENQNIRQIVDPRLWDLVEGRADQLNGFEGFDRDKIQSNLDQFLVGHPYPVLIQCLVLKKRN